MAFKGKFQGYANGGQEEHKEPSHSSQNTQTTLTDETKICVKPIKHFN